MAALFFAALIPTASFVCVASGGEIAQKPATLTKEGIDFFERHISIRNQGSPRAARVGRSSSPAMSKKVG
jgi:hypothetical protein